MAAVGNRGRNRHFELPSQSFHTLAGLVFDRLGRMPKAGD